MNDGDWPRLIRQLANGACTPFLGPGVCHGTLPTGSELSEQWAAEYGYPFPDSADLARVMEYAAFAEGDAVAVKELVCETLESIDPPDFSAPYEPHALLAGYPLPVFITTNYDDYLARALRAAGKEPRVALCPWSAYEQDARHLLDAEVELENDPVRPLVYHLHGSWANPPSLVLTESDYLEFLVNMAAARSNHDWRLVPEPVLAAMTGRPLLFIGYSLCDPAFQVIFYGLLRGIPDIHRRRAVSVQLPPPTDAGSPDARRRAMEFITHAFDERNITIFWGTAADFCRELRARADGTA